MGLLKKIFNVNKKHLKKLHDRAIQIDALKDDIAKLSDDELNLLKEKSNNLGFNHSDYIRNLLK